MLEMASRSRRGLVTHRLKATASTAKANAIRTAECLSRGRAGSLEGAASGSAVGGRLFSSPAADVEDSPGIMITA